MCISDRQQRLNLRIETADDKPFLERLFISVRASEPGFSDWPLPMRDQFLVSQFRFQGQHYANYPGKVFSIVEYEGQPVGRLYLSHTEQQIRIVDISLMPEARGQQLGTLLLRQVQAQGQALGKPIGLSVEMGNRARLLYHRLGFVETAQDIPYIQMIWQPESSNGSP